MVSPKDKRQLKVDQLLAKKVKRLEKAVLPDPHARGGKGSPEQEAEVLAQAPTLARLSITRPIFITSIVILMLFVGLLSYSKLGVDLFPDIEIPKAKAEPLVMLERDALAEASQDLLRGLCHRSTLAGSGVRVDEEVRRTCDRNVKGGRRSADRSVPTAWPAVL